MSRQAGRRGGGRQSRAVQPPVRIDIDPMIGGAFVHNRYDLLIRGRAISDQAIEEVVIRRDSEPVCRLRYEVPDKPGPADRQHAFCVNLPLRREQAHCMCACTIAARLAGGEWYEQNFTLVVNPSNPAPVSVASGRTHPSDSYPEARPPIVLYVERAALDEAGEVQLDGWAVSLNAIAELRASAGSKLVGTARPGEQRPDVAAIFPAYPNAVSSGFILRGQTDGSADTVSTLSVQAISENGCLHEILLPVEHVDSLRAPRPTEPAPPAVPSLPSLLVAAPRPTYRLAANFKFGPDLPPLALAPPVLAPPASAPARDSRRDIRFFCDEINLDADGNLSVVGWAVCAIGISAVTVHLDDREIGDAELGLPRTDVGEEYRHIPMARHAGFRLTRALGEIADGEHRIRVVLRNGLDDAREESRIVLIDRAPPSPDPMQFRLEIDQPTVVAGAAVEPVTGRLTVEGWALARSGISGIEVLLDDQRLGEAHYGLARQDVGTAFPDWVDSLRSGYAFHCPPRSLRNGEHIVQLNVRARSGDVLEHRFKIVVRKSEEFEEGATIRRRMTQVEVDLSNDLLESVEYRPGFRLLLRHRPDADDELLATIESLRAQVYRDWRLEILADNADSMRTLIVESAEDLAERIEVVNASDEAAVDRLMGSEGITKTLHLVGMLSAGDELGCDALLRIALAAGLHRKADLIYADEVRPSPVTGEVEAFFKPDFSPDLLLSTNYIGRPWFASTALLGRASLTLRDLLRCGEYDAVLRCTEQAMQVHHVPALLCRRGTQALDDAEREAAALVRAADRRDIAAEVSPGAASGIWHFRRTQPPTGRVSIIIPTCAAGGHIETCIKSLRERTAYRNFEIVCVDNISPSQIAWKIWLQRNGDKIVSMPDAFNWSHFNNKGVEAASGEYLLFLNDDIEITEPEWLDALLEHAQRPEVAVVGPQLLYPDNKVQHAGMFLSTPGIARHAFRFAAAADPGYFGLALTQRNVIAVTGACMLMRREVFEALGGFEEAHEIINNDLDFCLRAHQAGKLIVYTPHASLVHHEAASRDRLKDVFDLGQFEARWKTLFAAGDPYFSPRLSRHADDYRPDDEPAETIFAGHPLFRRADITRILVVKVDHIGDFVTAIPAIRRLKQIFPAAAIHVLASRAARALAEGEDCIDEFIEFEFFHIISGLGPREISKEEYQALRDRLAPYRFDIAVDLRKHLDTRDVLRHTPARFLAGYDHMGQFPFLDIALEWEGDRRLQRKRSHVTDDLINLVEAIGTTGETDRTALRAATPEPKLPDSLPDDARALFEKPVVAVHPGVGNVMRQWPAEHFTALIDLLVEKNSVNAVLIGGAEEAELAEQVLAGVTNRHAVASVVGKTALRELPNLLRCCALYIGNNSGPKHIAAAFGVPTIGIHSGVVDATEWGPIGRRAVAIRRDMTCSPCYLAQPEDCARGFACMNGLAPASVLAVAEFMLAGAAEQPPRAAPPQTQPAPPSKRKRIRRRQPVTAD